ncbi:ATP-binding protein [Streptomyces sp. TS71-3]|uniref:ATP-binding protein n=1 Tax=Streptomyces sp. TS71-3 TaxID=2733862 RepID=UPI001B099FEF|nr:ATP-binding protein [Streptomyces sp. TS71-3]GHJ35417.1 ATPase [Streptomyces sp. TS71-3]
MVPTLSPLPRPAGAPPNDPPSRPLPGSWEVAADRTTAHPALLRRIAKVHLELCGLAGSPAMDTVPLLLSELVANAIQHGGGEVRVRVRLGGWRLLIEVTDGGKGLPVLRRRGLEEESGRGLLLVEALAESWGVSEDGATTWCVISIPWSSGLPADQGRTDCSSNPPA